MSAGNCGLPDGAVHPHTERCYQAGRRDERATIEATTELEAEAYRVASRRLRLLHTSLAGRRQDWAHNDAPCSSARAVAYQSTMQSVHSIIDEIEAIATGVTRG